MILHAIALAARDLGLGALVAILPALLAAAGASLARRDRRRRVEAVERVSRRARARLRDHERRRQERRCYGSGSPTSAERWGRG